jgi:hypothetical protein
MNNNDILLQTIQLNMDRMMDWNISYTNMDDGQTKGTIQIGIEGREQIDYRFFVVNSHGNVPFQIIYGISYAEKEAIFLAHSLTENVKKELKDNYISYIEMSGNCFIYKHPLYVFISGNKKEKQKVNNNSRAFSKTGLKIIFAYLTSFENINLPIRSWAAWLDIGYTNFHYVNQGLKDLKYLIAKDANTMVLDNKKDLLERWVHHFEEKLKPSLLIGRFRFLDRADYSKWDKLQFKDTKTEWGGEPAGALLTGNLEPQTFTIYTAETKSDLITNYKIVPDEQGDIYVYENFFWHYPLIHRHTVHPILAYADLMITGESRNIKTAKAIYEQYIQY